MDSPDPKLAAQLVQAQEDARWDVIERLNAISVRAKSLSIAVRAAEVPAQIASEGLDELSPYWGTTCSAVARLVSLGDQIALPGVE